MNKRKIVFVSVALAGAIGLSSCGAATGQNSGQAAGQNSGQNSGQTTAGQTTAPADASSAAAATSSPKQPAAPTASAPASAAPSAAKPTETGSPDAAAGLASFTFPDGHLSFAYPKDWTVRVVKSDPEADAPDGVDPVQAVLADQTGNELLVITSGAYGGGASGPVLRTVLDAAPVPGLMDTADEQLDFGFAFDSFAGHPEFHMGIRRSRDFEPSPENSGSSQVNLPHGIMETRVVFGTPAFASIDSARAWMATEQYRQLKRLLLSLKYS
ncbi:hypothetical protein ACQCSU_15975 [Pseudarthrobacter sp. O4]|uniref:hypothetical protein n=1 Tax=Pseudarthrobacter sp. O4 TaxID=3418417 RepID=UPI003CF4A2BE